MRSIRRRLLAMLIGAIVATGAIAGAFIYRNALLAADVFFDQHLRETAVSLRDQAFEYAAPPDLSDEAQFDFVIQVWSITGVRVYLSQPHTSLPGLTTLGLSTVDVKGDRWRVFGVEARGHVIQVAQPLRVRQQQAARLAFRTLLPFGLAVPVLAFLAWLAVGRSLRPLEALAEGVRVRDPSTLSPLHDGGLPVELQPLVAALNDLLAGLSESRDRERRFLDDAAHELRTPLTALRLQLQALRTADDSERAAAILQIGAGIDRATRLVEQLLALARQPRTPAPHGTVALASIARTVVGDLVPVADAGGVDLGLTEAADATVLGDADALTVLLRNLVDNALRYTPRGGRVDVSVTTDPAFVVRDTGPGIPPYERERVFDRFHRLPGAPGVGSGLGLSIVRTIAEQHGARIALDDAPGGGLLATVRFPRTADTPEAALQDVRRS